MSGWACSGAWSRCASTPRTRGASSGRRRSSQALRCSPLRETANLYEFDSPQPCPLSVSERSRSLDNALHPRGHARTAGIRRGRRGKPRRSACAEVLRRRQSREPLLARARGRHPRRRPATAWSVADRSTAGHGPWRRSPDVSWSVSARGTSARRRLEPDRRSDTGRAIARLPAESRDVGRGCGTPRGRSSPTTRASSAAASPAARHVRCWSRTRRVRATRVASASAQMDVVVPAQITVKAKRTRVRNGRSVVLTGRVAGPIPHGGVLVAMEVREPGRWIPVATTRRWVRTRSSGTFALSYGFRSTFRASTYRFRVVADEDSAFQYGRGASRSIDIHVTP